ncbi:Ferric reductase like transmembrane component [Colletotrichum higginsianum IMI 349063]|uniref:Ferric reductase like transmembrane component n=1 Tax=Colletotrichum higginsianum (strain IMI 349063) TaxID=759273 RepID=A0A1B7YER0_COLHI|nr:Ferric reductase like transmembrane component [Colletotrichum higginsianum IMI 349063]OBR10496.1 Ferric reductase like transmembrane component [Colletotrichum higginsianum IMI 349063]
MKFSHSVPIPSTRVDFPRLNHTFPLSKRNVSSGDNTTPGAAACAFTAVRHLSPFIDANLPIATVRMRARSSPPPPPAVRRALMPTLLAALCLFVGSASGALTGTGGICFDSCTYTLRAPRFNDTQSYNGTMPAKSKLIASCESRLHIESLYLCADLHCDLTHRVAGLSDLNHTCQTYMNTSLPPFEIVAHYSDVEIAGLRRLTQEEGVDKTVLNEVVLPADAFYQIWFDTLESVEYTYGYHYRYGFYVIVFWFIVIAIGLASRLVAAIGTLQKQEYAPRTTRGIYRSCAVWLKRYITVPATFGYRCSQNLGWCTIPPRIQSLTIFAFIAVNAFFCIHGYIVFPGHMYWPLVYHQWWRYVADRTGIISFANFPIIWLFGMRNNLLMWLTGWDFGTYNNFHRWVARVATLQAVIHSVGYVVLVFDDGGWFYFMSYWKMMFWWAGWAATLGMVGLLVASVFWMRRKQYELFLILHILLSILTLITMLGHVSIIPNTYDILFWVPFYIWIADRVLRMSRTLSFNLRFWNTFALASYDASSNIVRLSVPYSTSFYEPKPGTYYYLHVLSDKCFWESHPFTMACTTTNMHVRRKSSCEETPLLVAGEQDQEPMSEVTYEPKRGEPTMTFLIRPYDSFTARLREDTAAAWPHPARLRVLVEGPYGHTQPFNQFDDLLFIVGGSGVVVPLAHLAELAKAESRARSVKIVWAVRELSFAVDVLRQDFEDAFEGGKLSVDVYVTQNSLASNSARPDDWPEQIRLLYGRPDVREEVQDAATGAGKASLAVVACGPAVMADDARKSVVEMLDRGWSDIEYFQESFNW